jgi:hypothetical protein
VVAASALRRVGWALAVALATAVLITLALVGARPDSGLVRFRPAGVMLGISPDEPTAVRVSTKAVAWRFTRGADGAWSGAGTSAAARVTEGLRLLHGAAPHRMIMLEELGDTELAEFGLDPPRYVVSVEVPGRTPFSVRFGGSNAQGLAQYVQIEGRDEIVLLPRYVGEAWEAAVGMR